MRGDQRVEVDVLDGGVPRPRRAPLPPDQGGRHLAPGPEPERRREPGITLAAGRGPGRLDPVHVPEEVGVIRRHRVGVRRVAGRAAEKPPDERPRRVAAGPGLPPCGERGVPGDDDPAPERHRRLERGRECPAPEGIRAQVGMERSRLEAPGRRGGIESVDADLLWIEGRIEGDLVTGPPRPGQARRQGEEGGAGHARPTARPRTPRSVPPRQRPARRRRLRRRGRPGEPARLSPGRTPSGRRSRLPRRGRTAATRPRPWARSCRSRCRSTWARPSATRAAP